MSSDTNEAAVTATVMTERAADAARRGDWPQVTACYRERAARLEEGPLSKEGADELRRLDAGIADQARLAQEVVRQLLAEALTVRSRTARLARLHHEAPPRLDRRI